MDLFHGEPMFGAVRQMTHALAEQEIRPIAALHDRDESMPWDLMKKASSFGLSQTAMLDTRRITGDADDRGDKGGERKPGRAARVAVVGAEELAWGCAGIGLALAGSGLAAAPVARIGSEEHKQIFLRALKGVDEAGHIKVAAMALSEPQTGSDISSLATGARRDGDHWVLNGHKQWITNGRSASIYVVWAQTDASLGRGGVRGFLVERGTPGLVPGRKETKLGIRASETAQVHFEDCRVHKDLMLGADRVSEGLGDTKKMLDATRPAVGAQAVGIARAAFEYLLERVRGGSLRGKPLAGHQHIAFALAEMEMEIQASRLLVHRAAWMADHAMDNVAFASMGKAHAARTAQAVTTRALALLGDEALEPGHPVEKWYRDAKIYDIFEGTGQIQRRIIAKTLTGLNAV
ncbi:MAG TPA: acyl-CoA dehydrogenase family protein [Kofleriaceae bacterium]|nr:acyl-CoA dehydrogenase family protein [Kofleriaceae bacterium]